MTVREEAIVPSRFFRRVLLVGFSVLPFFPAVNAASGIDLSSLRLFILVATLVWFARAATRGSIRIPFSLPAIAIASFFFFASLSFLWAAEPTFAVRKTIYFFSLLPVIILVSGRAVSPRRLLQAIVIGAALSSGAALFVFAAQFFIGGAEAASRISIFSPLFFGSSAAQAVSLFPSWFIDSGNGNIVMRAFFPFPNPHTAALFWGMGFALTMADSKWQIGKSRRTSRYLLFAIRYTLIAAILATFSRGAYIALAILLVTYSMRRIAKKRRHAIRYALFVMSLGSALLFVSSLLAPALYGRFSQIMSPHEGSSAARLALWNDAIGIFRENPLFGAGLGNYASAVDPLAPYRTPTNAHSTYLEIASELGIIGLFLFLLALGSALISSMRRAKAGSAAHSAVFSALLFFGVHAIFETDLYHPANLVFLLVLLTFAGSPPEGKFGENEAKARQVYVRT